MLALGCGVATLSEHVDFLLCTTSSGHKDLLHLNLAIFLSNPLIKP